MKIAEINNAKLCGISRSPRQRNTSQLTRYHRQEPETGENMYQVLKGILDKRDMKG